MRSSRKNSDIMTEDEAAEVIQKAYRNAAKRKEVLELYTRLTEKELKYIKPFFRKWRTKSLFSVLLRYRGKRIQDFFNLSQQVHLYNTNVYHKLLQSQEGINIEKIDENAQVCNYLNQESNSVLKLYFRLEDIPYYNTSHMSNLLTNIGELATSQEPWDGPYKWRESRSQTKEESTDDDMDNNEALSNVNFTRESDDDIAALPSPVESEEEKYRKDFINETVKSQRGKIRFEDNHIKTEDNKQFKVNLKKIDDSFKVKSRGERYTMNSAPANKDFDYIKATPPNIKPKYSADPILELKNMANKGSSTSDDEPPFNFQGMLRKTNFRRESLKNTIESVRRFSLTKKHENVVLNGLPNEQLDSSIINGKHCSLEILPGLIMEGVEIEM